eukprot:8651597-Pyramimonas_sp.AAC.1
MSAEHLIILLGDWNITLEGEGRQKACGGLWSTGGRRRAQAFNNILPDLIEFHQEMDTRRAIVDKVIDHTVRLDCIYCSLPSAILADMIITASTIG